MADAGVVERATHRDPAPGDAHLFVRGRPAGLHHDGRVGPLRDGQMVADAAAVADHPVEPRPMATGMLPPARISSTSPGRCAPARPSASSAAIPQAANAFGFSAPRPTTLPASRCRPPRSRAADRCPRTERPQLGCRPGRCPVAHRSSGAGRRQSLGARRRRSPHDRQRPQQSPRVRQPAGAGPPIRPVPLLARGARNRDHPLDQVGHAVVGNARGRTPSQFMHGRAVGRRTGC